MTDEQVTQARKLADEYRKTMDSEVLHSWAADAVTMLNRIAHSQAIEGAVKAYALAWWAANMPQSVAKSVTIKGDGRVDVHWQDKDESGKYTLPVDFIAATHATQKAQGHE